MNDLLNCIYLSLAFLVLFGSAELIYHLGKVKAELTRKYVHTGTGLLTLLFPILLSSHWWVLLLCGSFFIILLISLKHKFLPSINAIDRKSNGSLFYPVIVYMIFVLYEWKSELMGLPDFIYFYLPVLTMAICDPLAALFGKRWPLQTYKMNRDQKSIMGTGVFILSSILLTLFLFYQIRITSISGPLLLTALIIGVGAALTEAASRKGADNFFIPLSSWLLLLGCEVFILN